MWPHRAGVPLPLHTYPLRYYVPHLMPRAKYQFFLCCVNILIFVPWWTIHPSLWGNALGQVSPFPTSTLEWAFTNCVWGAPIPSPLYHSISLCFFCWLANCEFVLCISSVCLPYTCNRSPVYIQETGIYTAITHIPPHNSHSVYAGFSVPRRFVPFSLHLRNRDLCVGKASVGWGRPFRGGSSAM